MVSFYQASTLSKTSTRNKGWGTFSAVEKNEWNATLFVRPTQLLDMDECCLHSVADTSTGRSRVGHFLPGLSLSHLPSFSSYTWDQERSLSGQPPVQSRIRLWELAFCLSVFRLGSWLAYGVGGRCGGDQPQHSQCTDPAHERWTLNRVPSAVTPWAAASVGYRHQAEAFLG